MLLAEDLTPFPSYPRAGEQVLGGRSALLLQSWIIARKQVSCMTMASNSIVMWKLKLWLKITLLSFKLVFVGMLAQLWKLTGTHTYCVMEHVVCVQYMEVITTVSYTTSVPYNSQIPKSSNCSSVLLTLMHKFRNGKKIQMFLNHSFKEKTFGLP